MTRTMYVQRKAEDLRLGNMYVHWAVLGEAKYHEPARIIGIVKLKGSKKIKISLDDLTQRSFNPEHLVIVQEVA